ncbi:MAG TPA: right-handed parallel beta-helix repeat-containing protein [Terriglobia bacterium]|nr:right-handed parallel beta-helix repeat-containing protein [Terriglobia bacterium]
MRYCMVLTGEVKSIVARLHGAGLLSLILLIGVNFSTVGFFARAKSLSTSWRGDVTPGRQTVFFVSPQGNDNWSGKLDHPNSGGTDGPFRTASRARDAIRELKASGAPARPVIVYFRGGVYPLGHPLIFTSEDSGTSRAPITYEAYPGETPVLSGGRAITGWVRVSGSALPVPARGHLWVAEAPEVKKGQWYFHQLFVNGSRRTRARSPNQGFYYVNGLVSATTPAHFEFYDQDIHPQWAKQKDVEVVALQNWAELRMPIRAVNSQLHTVTLAGRRQAFAEANARYWVENTLDALDAPGEWYLDQSAGRVYYYPAPGEDLLRARVVASDLKQLIRFEGNAAQDRFVQNITFRGLTFSYTDWSMSSTGYADEQAAYNIPAAVSGQGVHFCTIEQCRFTHLGGYAIALGEGSRANRILRNEMTDLGAGGVKIGDPEIPSRPEIRTSGNEIADNHIHNIGRVYPAAVGVWIGQSSKNIIAHNEINDTFYTAISVGWTWGYGPTAAKGNLIQFNSMHQIGQGMLSDMGCIYTLGVQPGTVERNNLCHDVSRYKYGGWGIYTDEGSSDILIENNVVYRCEDGGFHQHYGEANIVRNNIFALGGTAQIRRSKNENHLSFTFERNIVYWNQGELFDGAWADNNYRFDHNLYYSAGWLPIEFSKWSFRDWQKQGQDLHSLIANPLFADPLHGDFSLESGSPAVKVGFQAIDLSKVGPSANR